MNKKIFRLFAFLAALSTVASLAACASSGSDTDTSTDPSAVTTAATTTASSSKGQAASASTKVESDYDVEKVSNFKVDYGTSEEDVIAMLPTELTVTLPSDGAPSSSEVLYTESFDDESSFQQNWTLCDADGVSEVGNGVLATLSGSTRFKAYINDQDWAKSGTEEYANYAVTMTLKGTADEPTNNFGMIVRASDVTESGADSYYGLYVGIGDSNGQLCVGYAENNWNSVTTVDFDYVPYQDYELTVLLYNEKYVVLLNGEKMYEGVTNFVNGTAGIRTYNQLFECSSYTVRTLNEEDYKQFKDGYVVDQTFPVVWTCTDYDPNTAGKYGFVGTIQGLEKAATRVIVTVREAS